MTNKLRVIAAKKSKQIHCGLCSDGMRFIDKPTDVTFDVLWAVAMLAEKCGGNLDVKVGQMAFEISVKSKKYTIEVITLCV